MLPKPKRLNLKKDFKWAAAGKRVNSKFATFFLRVGDNHQPRIGVAVSTRVFKRVVDRNRVKRVVFACFESLYNRLPSNINIVALPKAGVIDVKSGDLLLELEEVLEKEKILGSTIDIK
ncbi:ribonuclease P protein component [Candidatus Daviesbacteria bacterium]|nr:ribonuclease P protein component [Candidatus Daviesbacteria bacterium]